MFLVKTRHTSCDCSDDLYSKGTVSKAQSQNLPVEHQQIEDFVRKPLRGLRFLTERCHFVAGVTSFVNVVQEDGSAKICAGISSFTRLSSFTEWLEEIVGDDYCK